MTGQCHPNSVRSIFHLCCQFLTNIHTVLSKVCEQLVLVGLRQFMEDRGVFHPSSLLIGKVCIPKVYFCVCPIHCKVCLRVDRRLGLFRFTLVQHLIRSTYHIHQGLLISLCSVGIGGLFSYSYTSTVLITALMVDCFQNNLVNIVSVVSQGSVTDLLLFLLCTSQLFSIIETIYGYANDSTLPAAVPSPGIRDAVATCSSLITQLTLVTHWYVPPLLQ